MKKFSKIIENINSEGTYIVKTELDLLIKADNEGEAGYLADSILGSIEEQYSYSILNIEETDKNINDNL